MTRIPIDINLVSIVLIFQQQTTFDNNDKDKRGNQKMTSYTLDRQNNRPRVALHYLEYVNAEPRVKWWILRLIFR